MKLVGMTEPVRIYISAMETRYDDHASIDPKAQELIDRVRDAGYNVYWNKIWRPYPEILADIAASSAMLVIVDSTWTSSSWMAVEASWAFGEAGVGEDMIDPIPVFVYPVIAPSQFGWLKGRLDKLMVLDSDVATAVSQIDRALASIG